MKKSFTFLIFALITSFAFAQEERIDSLKKELSLAKHDSVRTKLKGLIGTEEGVSRFGFWDSIIADSEKWKLPSTEALAYINRGYIFFQQSKLDGAEKDWKKALAIAEKNKDYETAPSAAHQPSLCLQCRRCC